MEELSVKQVIEFSQRIEEESYSFYTQAGAGLNEPELKRLAEELAEAEVDHLNRLRHLLKQTAVTRADLHRRVKLDTSTYEKVIASQQIPAQPTSEDILRSALAREKATRSTYQMLVAMTDLGSDVADLFAFLYKQEEGHVMTIEKRLARR